MRGGYVEDSDRRCPFDHKKMLVETGQEDDTGWVRRVHYCLHCDYHEREEVQPLPLPTRVGETARRLREARQAEADTKVRTWVWDSSAGVAREVSTPPEPVSGPGLACAGCGWVEPYQGEPPLEARARMYRHCEDSHHDAIPFDLARQAREVPDVAA